MKKTPVQLYTFNSISELMRHLEQPRPQHPLVAMIDHSVVKFRPMADGSRVAMNFYKISLKLSYKGQMRYGQGYYDFEEGGLAFLEPNQIVTITNEDAHINPQGYSLLFHPDLIRNYPLGSTISKYGFFSYAVNEALFLSEKEKKVMLNLFETIDGELNNNIDHFSQDVLVSQIDLLLNYSNRYYNRQFITRKTVYNDLIGKMDVYLSTRLDANAAQSGLPTVQEVSDHLGVSPKYLTDMLKSLTGRNTQQLIHDKLIEKAKHVLSNTSLTIAEIAYELGFEHPQSFNKLFRQKTNMSPLEFRHSFN